MRFLQRINEARHGRDLYHGAFSSETIFHGPIALFNLKDMPVASTLMAPAQTPLLSSRFICSVLQEHLSGLLQGPLNAHKHIEIVIFSPTSGLFLIFSS